MGDVQLAKAEAANKAAMDAWLPANAQRILAARIEANACAVGIGDFGLQQLEQQARAARTIADAASLTVANAIKATDAAYHEVITLYGNTDGAPSQQPASRTLREVKEKVL